jgi:hypothetical protein
MGRVVFTLLSEIPAYQVCVCVCVCVCVYVCVVVYVNSWVMWCSHCSVRSHPTRCVHVCVCECVCMCMYVSVYVCVPSHTHTHSLSHTHYSTARGAVALPLGPDGRQRGPDQGKTASECVLGTHTLRLGIIKNSRNVDLRLLHGPH